MRPQSENSCLFYVQQAGPRLEYILSVLFDGKFAITQDVSTFISFEGPKLQYTQEKIFQDTIHIQPQGILFNSTIQPINFECSMWNEVPIFFQGQGDIPFDLPGAAFYLITRYEEYLSFEPDEIGRYPHTASIAFQENFLSKPIIQHWVALLKKKIGNHFFQSIPHKPLWVPGYDADILFKYQFQSSFTSMGKFVRNLWEGNSDELLLQWKVMRGRIPDPFDIWEQLWHFCENEKIVPRFFFSGNEQQHDFDKQTSFRHPKVSAIIKGCQQHGKLGWHPSFQCSASKPKMEKELAQFQSVAPEKIIDVRFHYLRFTLPQSYRWLLDLGIENDYSMGYGAVNGFRASYSDPFFWFDLERNQVTSLRIHPFCFMDSTCYFHLQSTPEDSFLFAKKLQSENNGLVKQLACVFHPHLLAIPSWWHMHYQLMEHTDLIK